MRHPNILGHQLRARACVRRRVSSVIFFFVVRCGACVCAHACMQCIQYSNPSDGMASGMKCPYRCRVNAESLCPSSLLTIGIGTPAIIRLLHA